MENMIISGHRFGNLIIKNTSYLLNGSNKKVLWVCDCGREKLIQIYKVTSGHNTSCGQCNIISATEITTKKFGKLQIKTPQDILPNSHNKILWMCDCGREKLIQICNVINNHTSSCGQCNLITADYISKRKFGGLRIKEPKDIFSGSAKKIEWICDCGREKLAKIINVISGDIKSCGKCNLITASEIAAKKFGKLRIKKLQDILLGSHKKIDWICDCGQEKNIGISCVTSGHTKSCGQCSESVKNWYIQNKEQIRALKCPIDLKDFIPGGIIPLEIINRSHISFKAICPACQKIYNPRLFNIKRGLSLTCGCCEFRISFPCIQITEYIRSLGFEVQNEFKVNKLAYDIFVPAKNLLIEFQGSKWHSSEKSKERDLKKKQNAIQNGYQFKEILEKDWNTKRDEIENNLKKVI
jgi:hypothetical protein